MRCPSCKKFVAFEEAEPDVQMLDIDEDGTVTATVCIVNLCAECSQELTEYIFDVTEDVEIPVPVEGHTHVLMVENQDSQRTQPDHTPPRKDGKLRTPRYRTTWYGFALTALVSCHACDWTATVTLADDVQASGMEALI